MSAMLQSGTTASQFTHSPPLSVVQTVKFTHPHVTKAIAIDVGSTSQDLPPQTSFVSVASFNTETTGYDSIGNVSTNNIPVDNDRTDNSVEAGDKWNFETATVVTSAKVPESFSSDVDFWKTSQTVVETRSFKSIGKVSDSSVVDTDNGIDGTSSSVEFTQLSDYEVLSSFSDVESHDLFTPSVDIPEVSERSMVSEASSDVEMTGFESNKSSSTSRVEEMKDDTLTSKKDDHTKFPVGVTKISLQSNVHVTNGRNYHSTHDSVTRYSDLGILLQGQMRTAKLKSAYNSLIIGPRCLGW